MVVVAISLLLIHGAGHLLGVIASFRKGYSENWNVDSWLFNAWTDRSARKSIAAMAFIMPALSSIVAALTAKGLIYEVYEWRDVALIAAISSLIAIGLFPKGLYSLFNRSAAILLNLAIIAIMLTNPWLSINL